MAARVACLFFLGTASETAAQTLAFPSAEGYGRFASGGRGGDVYIVTNLNNSGAGSLREGVVNRTAGVPRTIVFAVSGTLYLQSTLRIVTGDLTIAGQTAPGDGICLAYYPLDPGGSTNVIIRFLRSRLGDTAGLENDAFSCRYATNIIVDHCSFSWSVDETATAYLNTHFTMQWCIAAESLRDSVHSKGPHGYGGIWGGFGASFHHNLIAHHDSRNPRFSGAATHNQDGELVDMRNNVIYNWKLNSTYGGEPTDTGLASRQNMVNNYYKPGPATGTGAISYRVLNPSANPTSTGSLYGLFHVSGNRATASDAVTSDNWNGGVQGPTAAELAAMRADTPFAVAPVATQSADAAMPLVLAYAGCRLPARDSVDTRIVSEVTDGTATYRGSKNNYPGIIDSQADVGGWPALASLPSPTDTDKDGMPDAWENSVGLNRFDPSDRNLTDASGYTRLENYLSSLAASAFPTPTFTQNIADTSVAEGGSVSFSVSVASSADYSSQWYKNGVAIAGATGLTLSLAHVAASDAGTYKVVVSSVYGTAESDSAVLTVVSSFPAVVVPPSDISPNAGQSAGLSVTASGAAPLSYQWYRGSGRAVAGATGATLTFASVTPGDAGLYYVVVSNRYGSATSSAAALSVQTGGVSALFATTFATDTIHAASPVLTATSTNWYVMSSKNATGSSVGDNPSTTSVVETRPLDLTMALTTSGVVEAAAHFFPSARALPLVGDRLRVRMVFVPANCRAVGVGFFNSGGVNPYTGLINSLLTSGSTTYATGGAQNWRGYRFSVVSGATAATLEARPAQAGANNTSQSLIVSGTSSSAPSIVTVGTASTSPTAAILTDGQTYTLTTTLTRTTPDAFSLACTVHAGTDTTASPLFSSTATTTASAATPDAIATAFNAIAIGYRNRDGNSVSRLTISSLSIEQEGTPATYRNTYDVFLATHGLDAVTNGADTADPDGDGVANTLEFVLDGDPLSPAAAPQPALTLTGDGQAAFAFDQRIDALETFVVSAERSTDLAAWTLLTPGGGIAWSATPIDAARERVIITLPLGTPRLFIRLRAQRP